MNFKDIVRPYGVKEKYISYTAWLVVIAVLFISAHRFPLSRPIDTGDESWYRIEVDYLAKYGLYNALTQGTSFIYSLLIWLCAKAFGLSFLISARVLSVIGFLVSSALLARCFDRFIAITPAVKYLALTAFAVVSCSWITKGLPDLVWMAFFLAGFYLVSGPPRPWAAVAAGVLLFIGFAIKPTALFTLPGLALYLLLKDRGTNTMSRNVVRTALFVAGFSLCFVVYHLPGYQAYHRLMLEDKSHHYVGAERVQEPNRWIEKNVYFEVYNVHHKPNKWMVTFEEVDSFKQQHPEINLNLGYMQFLQAHPAIWVRNYCSKIFLTLPYGIQGSFFFAKWTAVNRLVKSILVIQLISLLIIAGMCRMERKFIRENLLLFLVPLLYYLTLCCYIVPQLEDNYLLCCLPLLALPVAKFLSRYVNIILLLVLQLVYVLVV